MSGLRREPATAPLAQTKDYDDGQPCRDQGPGAIGALVAVVTILNEH